MKKWIDATERQFYVYKLYTDLFGENEQAKESILIFEGKELRALEDAFCLTYCFHHETANDGKLLQAKAWKKAEREAKLLAQYEIAKENGDVK